MVSDKKAPIASAGNIGSAQQILAGVFGNTKPGYAEASPAFPRTLLACMEVMLNSPAALCILWGEQHLLFWNNACANITVFHSFPKTQGISASSEFSSYWHLLEPTVRAVKQGQPLSFDHIQLPFITGGKSSAGFSITLSSITGDEGGNDGVLIGIQPSIPQATVAFQQQGSNFPETRHESEKQFRNLVLQSPVPMAILLGADMIIELANPAILNTIWQKDFGLIKQRKLLDVFPELEGQQLPGMMLQVLKTGNSIRQNEVPEFVVVENQRKLLYLDVQLNPLHHPNGQIEGVIITASDVTEKVQSRQFSEDAEERMRLAIEASDMGTFNWDLQTQEFDPSPRLCEIFGFDAVTKITHQQFIDAFHPADKPVRDKAIRDSLANGSLEYELRIFKPGLIISWIKVYGKIVYNEQRQPLRMHGTVKDVTREKNILLQLEESRNRLNRAIDTAALGTYDVDIATSLINASPRLYDIMGIPHGKALTRNDIRNILYSEDLAKRNMAHEKALETGKVEYESRIVWKDGSIHWIKVNSQMLLDAKRIPFRILGTVMDITEQKNYIHHLEESELRFRVVADSAPVMIWMSDKDGFCQFINKRWLQFTGRSKEQELGSGWLENIHPDDAAIRHDVYNNASRTNEEFYVEYRLKKHTGEYRWLADQGIPRFDTTGNFLGYIGGCMDIDEQKRHNEKISKSEARLRIAALSGELGTWDYEPQTDELYWDDACARMFGVEHVNPSPAQLFWSVVHPDDDAFLTAKVRDALNPNTSSNFDVDFRVTDTAGNLKWINAKGKSFVKDDQVYRFAGTVLDITDKKLALEALKKSEERFRLLANTMPQFVWTADATGNLNYFNESVYRYSQLGYDELNTGGWIQIVHPDDRKLNIEKWLHSINSGEDFFYEHRFRRYDGEYRWQLSRAVPQKSSDGTIQLWIGTSTDIHDQKLMAEELENKVQQRTAQLQQMNIELTKQKEFVEVIIDSSLILVTVFDIDRRIISFNNKCEQVFNLKKAEVIGRRLEDIFEGIEDSATYKNLTRALAGETIHLTKFRSTVTHNFYESFYTPLKDANGNVYAALVTAHDITDIVKSADKVQEAYMALEEQNKALERSNQELESFSYVASHDLQEPLRKIQTFIELLHRNFDNLNESEKYFGKIRQSAQRMSALITDVLNYSRLSKENEAVEKTDLNKIIENIKLDFELLISEKAATINTERLPVIDGIALQLQQLFANLVNNSLKFTTQKPEINIRYEKIEQGIPATLPDMVQSKGYHHIIFSDNGIGFEQQFSEKIFTIFQRLNNREFSGTGIGLALCKKIVENHNGIIRAESTPGNGATFHIYLPA